MLLNFIGISDVRKTVEAVFYTQKQQNQHPIQVHPNNSVELFRGDAHFKINEPLYFSLTHPDEECCGKSFTGTLDFERDNQMAKRVINHWLYNHFRTHADAVRFNKVGQLEVWIKDPDAQPYADKATQYLRFSVVPYYDIMEQPWSLRVAFNGISITYNKPLSQLDLIADSFGVLVDKEVVRSQYLNNKQKHLLSEAYPVINKRLATELNVPEKRYRNPNKYLSTKSRIEFFCANYLFKFKIEQLQFASSQAFSAIPSSNQLKVADDSKILVFGNNQEDTDPLNGIKKYGVYKTSNHSRIILFFIYEKEHQQVAQRLYNILMHDVYSDELKIEYDDGNAKNILSTFINEQFSTQNGLSIIFTSLQNANKEIEAGLIKQPRKQGEFYTAIFISPVPKDGINNPYHELYYQVKEKLLWRAIPCQAIYFDNPSKNNFKFYLPNIAVALSAKVGGIPYKLKTYNPNMDLVIGVGAFRSSLREDCYVGSAFCFDGEGVFQELNCYRHDRNDKLVADIRKAIGYFMKNNKLRHPERLIIHYYKKMRKSESNEIMKMLLELNFNIPIYIVTVNKTETCDFFAFDESENNLMPLSGTIVKLNSDEFLLYNNAYYGTKPTNRYLFPIRLRMIKVVNNVGRTSLTDEEATDMLNKVYQFSRLYWKSVSQQSLPVTIAYSEMMAEIVPHFKDALLPPFGKTSLWPL